jgi:hypothetical protein
MRTYSPVSALRPDFGKPLACGVSNPLNAHPERRATGAEKSAEHQSPWADFAMNPENNPPQPFSLGPLLRGEADVIADWIAGWSALSALKHAVVIAAGAGAFGAAMGGWRALEQAAYAGVKLPLILLATAAGNGLLNGLLAPLLGLNLRLREAFAAVLTSFSLAAVILGAFSPLMAFLVWNLPPLKPDEPATTAAHSVMLLTLVAVIALAGITANMRLLQLLRRLGGSDAAARKILLAWLAVNLLLGSQLSWNLRPFIGTPSLPVEFLRDGAFHGNFFESVFHSIRQLWPASPT